MPNAMWDNDVEERLTVLPLGRYSDGGIYPAWPEMIAAPVRGFNAMWARGDEANINNPEALAASAADSFDAAGGAMTGGLAAQAATKAAAKAATPTVDLNPHQQVKTAIKIGDDYFVGQSHTNGLIKAQDHYGLPWEDFDKLLDGAHDGFLSNGRYFSRQEAMKILGSENPVYTETNGIDRLADVDNYPFWRRKPGTKIEDMSRVYSNAPTGAAVPLTNAMWGRE